MQRIVRFALAALCTSSVLAISAAGQENGVRAAVSAQRQQPGSMNIAYGGNGPRMVGSPITGMPYSAQQVTETVQTLADGTHIRQNQRTVVMYRDSAGRTRTETPIGPPREDSARIVRIVDVVGGYEYTLDDESKVAHRVIVQVAPPIAKRVAAAGNGVATARAVGISGYGSAMMSVGRVVGPPPEMQSEDLGTQTIEGITAHGRRTTQTWPVDSVGNDRPIVAVHENWFSEQMGMAVLSKNNDPRYGETTTSLKNVSLAEPDPSLFQPPPGYQIVDESGSFKIAVPQPQPR